MDVEMWLLRLMWRQRFFIALVVIMVPVDSVLAHWMLEQGNVWVAASIMLAMAWLVVASVYAAYKLGVILGYWHCIKDLLREAARYSAQPKSNSSSGA